MRDPVLEQYASASVMEMWWWEEWYLIGERALA